MFDLVFCKECSVFILKAKLLMMFFLVSNVTNDFVKVAATNRECSVASLPGELSVFLVIDFFVFRRFLFDVFQQLALREGARKRGDNVDVIADTSHFAASGSEIAAKSGQIPMHRIADFVVEKGIAFFRGKDEVEVNV